MPWSWARASPGHHHPWRKTKNAIVELMLVPPQNCDLDWLKSSLQGHQGLVVALSGLTKDVVKSTFMEIELPESGPLVFALGMVFPTIGAFYDAILRAFQQIDPAISSSPRSGSWG
jgi:hypothetical protein